MNARLCSALCSTTVQILRIRQLKDQIRQFHFRIAFAFALFLLTVEQTGVGSGVGVPLSKNER